MAFIYVGIVMVLTYFIDGFIIKRDITYINNHINDRRQIMQIDVKTEGIKRDMSQI